ncbi:hypothetical protein ABPG72_008088 [Tetrahymena utriculariae]
MSDSEDTVICYQQIQHYQELEFQNSPLKLNQKVSCLNIYVFDNIELFIFLVRGRRQAILCQQQLFPQQKSTSEKENELNSIEQKTVKYIQINLNGIQTYSLSIQSHANQNVADYSDKFESQNIDSTCQNASNDQTHNVSHLSRVRIIKKNLVYVIGIAPQLANEQILQSYQYFGQYGNIQKIVVNKNNIYNPKGPNGPSYSAYITYSEEKEASLSILGAENFKSFDRIIRASYGTTKYCSYFLKKLDCPNIPDCLYLHSYEKDDDYFSKDEMLSNKNIFIDQQKIAIKHVKKYIPDILREYQQNKSFYESQSHIFALPNLSKIIDKLKEHCAITNEQYLACREYQQVPNAFVLSQFLPNIANQHGLNKIYGSFIAYNTALPQQKMYDYDCKLQQSSYFNPFSQCQESHTTINPTSFHRQEVYYEKKNNFLSQSAINMKQGIYNITNQNQSPFTNYSNFSPLMKTQYFNAQCQSEYVNTQYCFYDLVKQAPQITPFEINDQLNSQDAEKQKTLQQKFDNLPPPPPHNNFNIYQQNNDNLNLNSPNEDKLNSRLQQEILNTNKQECSQLNFSYEKDKKIELNTSDNISQIAKECSQADKNCTPENQENNFKSEIESNFNYQYSTLTETNKELTDTQSQQSIEDNLNPIQCENLQIQNSKQDVFNKMLDKKSLKQIQSQVSHLSQKSSHSLKSNCSLGESSEEEKTKCQEIQQNNKCEQDSLSIKGEGSAISQNKYDSGSKIVNPNYELIANFWEEKNFMNKQQQFLLKQQNKCLGQQSEYKKDSLCEEPKILEQQQNQEKNAFYNYESEQNSFQELCSGFNTFVLTKFY